MRRHKAAGPANRIVRKPRSVDRSGGQIGTEATPDILSMQAVYAGSTCVGFIFCRGRSGFEAFNTDTVSLGMFVSMKAAADAVTMNIAAVTKAAGGEA